MIQFSPGMVKKSRGEPAVKRSLRESPARFGELAAFDSVESGLFTVWDLAPRELHDAYWRSRGVQCIRRGQPQPLQRAAELFLLIDPCQLVLFDLTQLSDRLTWRDAAVTRVRLMYECPQRYSERVVTDETGCVDRIVRRYRPDLLCSSRLMITTQPRVARAWMAARTRSEALRRIRNVVPWTRVDHWRGSGSVYLEGNPQQEQRLIARLIEIWPCPAQAINGLEEAEPGVWRIKGEQLTSGVVRVGPLWIGRGGGPDDRTCLIGPAWIADQFPPPFDPKRRISLKSIDDIEPISNALNGRRSPSTAAINGMAKHGPASSARFARSASLNSYWYPRIKRAIDFTASLSALIVSLPVMMIVALMILMEDGRPLFFGHTRQGLNGRPFRCWKFRTMRRGAHRMANQLKAVNICDGPQVYIKNDPRVTRVGRLLRKANLDELPQFWNVLAGHMSLVGPRPSPDNENQFCPAWRDLRLSVRPGITGLWQLNRTRRRGSDFQEWIKYDIQYVQHASVWFDLIIMFRTALLFIGWRKKRDASPTE